MLKHKMKTMSIKDLTPAKYNPRTIGKEALAGLAASLKRFGLVQPIVWNKTTGNVVGGHQRLKVLAAAGETEVPVIEVDLPPGEEKALNVTLNSPAVAGVFTDDLQGILEQIQEAVPQGWLDLRLDELVDGKFLDLGHTDPDDVPELPKKAITKLGDIWSLGEHRLMCGNSIDKQDVQKLINKNTVDMVYNDPPYGINAVKTVGTKRLGSIGGSKAFGAVGGGKPGAMYPFGGAKNLRGRVHGPARNAIIAPNLYAPIIGDDTTETAIASYKLCALLGIKILIFWGGNYYANALPPSRCWIVWDKENTGTFADGEIAWTNIDAPLRIFRHMWSGLMKASERGQRRVHPTQKPVALAVWSIQEFCKDAKVVMDLFGGSGSTLIACEQTKRRCLTMEMSPAYCDVIMERWQKFSGGKAKRA